MGTKEWEGQQWLSHSSRTLSHIKNRINMRGNKRTNEKENNCINNNNVEFIINSMW